MTNRNQDGWISQRRTAIGGALAVGALLFTAAAGQAAAPNVEYTAVGTFATPPLSGADVLEFAGEPFALSVVLNEATKPTRHSETMAEYGDVNVKLTLTSRVNGARNTYFFSFASLFLIVGAPGMPDWFIVTVKVKYMDYPLFVLARVNMPAGTIATPAIRPFTAPVTLTPGDAAGTYACPDCPPPFTGNSTTLAVAGGTLNATAQ